MKSIEDTEQIATFSSKAEPFSNIDFFIIAVPSSLAEYTSSNATIRFEAVASEPFASSTLLEASAISPTLEANDFAFV